MDDLISRQAAYKTLTEYYHHTTEIQHKALREALERVPDSQPELIEREAYIRGFEQGKTQGRLDALSAQPEPCEDTISRKAAIELVKDVCDAIMSGCESWYDPETEDEVYKDIREVDAILKCNKEIRIALRNMPSIV